MGRREGENEAEAMNECLNETVNAFSQSGADELSCAFQQKEEIRNRKKQH